MNENYSWISNFLFYINFTGYLIDIIKQYSVIKPACVNTTYLVDELI